MLPKMSAYKRDFDGTKYISLLMKKKNCEKSIMKSGINIAIASKRDFLVRLYAIKNMQKVK